MTNPDALSERGMRWLPALLHFILNTSAPLGSVSVFVYILMFFLMKTENVAVSSKANTRRDDNKQNQARKSYNFQSMDVLASVCLMEESTVGTVSLWLPGPM